jgi:hypothetical protein
LGVARRLAGPCQPDASATHDRLPSVTVRDQHITAGQTTECKKRADFAPWWARPDRSMVVSGTPAAG